MCSTDDESGDGQSTKSQDDVDSEVTFEEDPDEEIDTIAIEVGVCIAKMSSGHIVVIGGRRSRSQMQNNQEETEGSQVGGQDHLGNRRHAEEAQPQRARRCRSLTVSTALLCCASLTFSPTFSHHRHLSPPICDHSHISVSVPVRAHVCDDSAIQKFETLDRSIARNWSHRASNMLLSH